MRWLLTGIALLLLSSGVATALDREVFLQWSFEEDSRFTLVSEREVRTETTTTAPLGQGAETVVEKLEEKVSLSVHVLEQRKDGTHLLDLRLNRIETKQSAGADALLTSGKRFSDGTVKVLVSASNPADPLFQPEARQPLERITENLFKCRWEVELTREGRVVSSRIIGDPFADLPDTDPLGQILSRIAPNLLTADDLAGLIGAEAFAQFPERAVKPGESWDVEHRTAAMGLAISGKGKAAFESLSNIDGRPAARIREEVNLEVRSGDYADRLAKQMRVILDATGVEADVEVSLEDPAPVTASSETTLELTAGHRNSTTAWKEHEIPLRGEVRLTLLGVPSVYEFAVKVTTSGSVTIR